MTREFPTHHKGKKLGPIDRLIYELMGRKPYNRTGYEYIPLHIELLMEMIEEDYAAMLAEEEAKREKARRKFSKHDMDRARRDALRDYMGRSTPSGLNY